jgi:hypothetical protein
MSGHSVIFGIGPAGKMVPVQVDANGVVSVSGGGGGGGGSSIDRELVVSTFRAVAAATGYSIGNTITATRVLDVSGPTVSQVGATVWFNETTGLELASAPSVANLELVGTPSLTDAQLRATPVPVSFTQTGLTDAQIRATPLPVSFNGQTASVLEVDQAIPDAEDPIAIATRWGGFTGVDTAGGDFVTYVPGLNGQPITAVSASPLTTGESFVINTNKAVAQPAAMEIAASFVRTGISFATAALFSNAEGGPDPVPSPINIVSCYQSSAVQGAAYNAAAGTVMHITLATALAGAGTNQGVFIGDWINITGLVDNRLNYPNACINYISPDRTVIAVGFSDEVALPSLAVATITPTLGAAKVNFYSNLSGARNGFGLRLSGTTATSLSVVSIFGGDDNQVSGTLLGDQRVATLTTAPTYVAGQNWGQYEIRASTRFMLECTPSASVVMDKAEQTQASWTPRDTPRTSVKPGSDSQMYPRFLLYKPISMSRPVAKIVSAAKTGTTTATVTTAVAHGLVTGNWVTVKGARDVTNFAPLTVPVQVTVLTTTTFTLVWGTAVTATTYGGTVVITNGGRDQPGIIGQTVSSVVSRVAAGGNWLDVTGNTTWAGVNLGDYVDLYGVRQDLNGNDLSLDGAWEVAHLATSVMTLRPVFNIFGARVSPALGTLGSTNCGGAVILRPTVRNHGLSVTSWPEGRVGIDGAGTTRLDKTIPVLINGGTLPVVTTVSSVTGVTTVSSITSANLGIPLTVADVASAALTATATTAAIVPASGMSYVVSIPVTAVTGTTPTLDFSIEESDDTGTNWYKVYDFPRITATGMYRSPKLAMNGNRVRYVQTVAGTTPSFTRAVNRLQCNDMVDPVRQLIDRSVVLTTLNSATPALNIQNCRNVQLVVNVGAITTTAPSLQIQGSDDVGASWYSIGSPLTAVASSSVQTTVVNVQSQLVRVLVSTAGVGVTAGYVLLKGF